MMNMLMIAVALPCAWLSNYDGSHLTRVSMPLGGIGTGSIGLGGRGELRDWEIMNRPAKGHCGVAVGNEAPFFAIRAGGFVSLLEGPVAAEEYDQAEGRSVNHHGFPRFASASFSAAYPYGRVSLDDPASPVGVELVGFNPLIPGDSEASSLPVASLTYRVSNKTGAPVEVSIAGALRNFVGCDGTRRRNTWYGEPLVPDGACSNRNAAVEANGLRGVLMSSDGVDRRDAAWGTIALVTDSDGEFSRRLDSVPDEWSRAILDIWEDFAEDGSFDRCGQSNADDPFAAVCVRKSVPAGGSAEFHFVFTWHFPNRRSWYGDDVIVGNHYCGLYADAWDAAQKIVPRLDGLARRTCAFVDAFVSCDYPHAVKEAALFNLAVLRSQTVFRLPSGHMMGWEGVFDHTGLCWGSCTHVWNYESATAHLFGDLSRSMRDVEFNHALKPNGAMAFRAWTDLEHAADRCGPAADGQMGTVMRACRDWMLSGDDEWLRSIWPNVRRALAFAWSKDGEFNWDSDRDGVMEGRQHNTMDVDYHGPNPLMEFWYLGALRAGSRMARAVGDTAFADECDELYRKGSAWTRDNLFNGEYYEQKTVPGREMYQIGAGCLVDQLVGATFAKSLGFGPLVDAGQESAAIAGVMKYNFVPDFSRHFNNMRSFVMGGESGLLMASWPRGKPEVPFPYYREVMTGFEYAAAAEMVYAGMRDEALRVATAVRARHDGAKRNPFSENECGRYYARSMASWGLLNAWGGFSYSAPDGRMTFTDRPGRYFWANGSAFGTATVANGRVSVDVVEGTLPDGMTAATESGRAPVPAKPQRNGEVWHDTAGHVINAHGGCVMEHGGRYWLYGEHKVYGTQGNVAHVGVHCYSSDDLASWRDEGIALAVSGDPKSDIADGCVLERPKVVYCSKTGRFVMYFHLERPGRGYSDGRIGIAVADSPSGPFAFLRSARPTPGTYPVNARPEEKGEVALERSRKEWEVACGRTGEGEKALIYPAHVADGQDSRDMTLYVDDDGRAWLVHSSERNSTLHFDELTDDYLGFTGRWWRFAEKDWTEAPALCKKDGWYFLVGSDCTGWAPNEARYYRARSLTGPWERVGNPCRGVNPANGLGPEKTWGGQSNYILRTRDGRYIAMFDIWNPENQVDSRLVWLPVEFGENEMTITWKETFE